jgi:epoxyqueuosine reductase
MARVRLPVDSTIRKWVYRHVSQSVCPFNVKFAQELKEPAFKPREFLANKDAKMLAADLLAMSQDEFSAAIKKSPMKRAKLAGLKRNATVIFAADNETEP